MVCFRKKKRIIEIPMVQFGDVGNFMLSIRKKTVNWAVSGFCGGRWCFYMLKERKDNLLSCRSVCVCLCSPRLCNCSVTESLCSGRQSINQIPSVKPKSTDHNASHRSSQGATSSVLHLQQESNQQKLILHEEDAHEERRSSSTQTHKVRILFDILTQQVKSHTSSFLSLDQGFFLV